MAKRYNDSRKYNDPFFRKLLPEYKCLWDYLLSTCDHAGIWKVDFDLASFCIGTEVSEKIAIDAFNGRVLVSNNKEKWFIPGFLSFQYGELDSNNRVHNSVIRILDKEQGSFKGRLRVMKGYIYKDKDKDKDRDKDKDIDTYSNIYKDIISDLNTKNSSKFKITQKTKALISSRINEGFTKEDFFKVHDNKLDEWGKDEKMCKYLRPETLYSNKFDGYLNQKNKVKESGAKEWIKSRS